MPGDKYDEECNRQILAIATAVYNTLREHRTSNANDAWGIAYASARKLVSFTPLQNANVSPPSELAHRQDEGFSQRIALMARGFFPILRGQDQSENVAWSLAYGLSYQLVTLIDIPGSHWNSSAGSKGACIDSIVGRLVGNEILKYGRDPVLGMPNYMAEYVHKITIRIADDTRDPVAFNNNILTINPRIYAGTEPLFGLIVTSRLGAEQAASQAGIVKLKALMGQQWQDVNNSNGWGDTVEVKQLRTYGETIGRKMPALDAKSAAARTAELANASACQ